MKHKWHLNPVNRNVLLPEDWVCANCPERSFSAHLLDEVSECSESGAPDYQAEHNLRVKRYMEDRKILRGITEEQIVAGAREAHHLESCACPGYPDYQCRVNNHGVDTFRRAVIFMLKYGVKNEDG